MFSACERARGEEERCRVRERYMYRKIICNDCLVMTPENPQRRSKGRGGWVGGGGLVWGGVRKRSWGLRL